MAREIRVEGAGEYELWFGIGRSKIRFSKREFCLVTGLKFGCLSNIINEEYESVDGGIHERYFNNNPDLLVKALHEAFMKVEFKNKKDALKMALVLFVELILMGQDYRHKVSRWLLRLVEDLRAFNRFPWGEYIFKMTFNYIKQAFRNPREGKTVARYNLYGFPTSFQVCYKHFS